MATDVQEMITKRSQSRLLRWLGRSKPGEWITSLATLLGVLVAVTSGILVLRTGLFDAKRSELEATTALLKIEEKGLEARRAELLKEVETATNQARQAKDEAKAARSELEIANNQAVQAKAEANQARAEANAARVELARLKGERDALVSDKQRLQQNITHFKLKAADIANRWAREQLAAIRKLLVESGEKDILDRNSFGDKFRERLGATRYEMTKRIESDLRGLEMSTNE